MQIEPKHRVIGKHFQIPSATGGAVAKEITIPLLLDRLLQSLRLATADGAALGTLMQAKNPATGLTSTDNVNFEYNGYQISLGLRTYLDDFTRKLIAIDALDIKSAPKLVEYILIDNAHSVLITYFPQNEKSKLAKYESVSNAVHTDVKDRFLDDMRKLLDSGFVIDYAIKGTGHWFYNQETNEIIINSWSSLRELEHDEDKDKIMRLFSSMVKKGYKGFSI